MKVTSQSFDQERAFYGQTGLILEACRFEGPADGESALKRCRSLKIDGCHFALRYPLWHCDRAVLKNCTFAETCRAPFWYDRDLELQDCAISGPKSLRECDRISLTRCNIESDEFAWHCRDLNIKDCRLTSGYPFFECKNLKIDRLQLNAKYAFQYVEGGVIQNSRFKTKDAFWHSQNLTVIESRIEGEYLGWYSQNLHLIRCHIVGTQPLCDCEGLVLEDCTTENCDLAFERSALQARIYGEVQSIKNPQAGQIELAGYGELIQNEQAARGSDCKIIKNPSLRLPPRDEQL